MTAHVQNINQLSLFRQYVKDFLDGCLLAQCFSNMPGSLPINGGLFFWNNGDADIAPVIRWERFFHSAQRSIQPVDNFHIVRTKSTVNVANGCDPFDRLKDLFKNWTGKNMIGIHQAKGIVDM